MSLLTTLLLTDVAKGGPGSGPHPGGGSADRLTHAALLHTKLANNSKRVADHRGAAKAHKDAAAAQRANGNFKQAAIHDDMAQQHEARSALRVNRASKSETGHRGDTERWNA